MTYMNGFTSATAMVAAHDCQLAWFDQVPLARRSGLVIGDAGCGDGTLLARAMFEHAPPGAQVWGIDADAAVVAMAKRRVGTRGRIVHGTLANTQDWPPRLDVLWLMAGRLAEARRSDRAAILETIRARVEWLILYTYDATTVTTLLSRAEVVAGVTGPAPDRHRIVAGREVHTCWVG